MGDECAKEKPPEEKQGFWERVKEFFTPSSFTPQRATPEDYKKYRDITTDWNLELISNAFKAKSLGKVGIIEWMNLLMDSGREGWDYKNKEEYEGKKFIYNGMVFTADDLGNMNYGMTARIIGIPFGILKFGGLIGDFRKYGFKGLITDLKKYRMADKFDDPEDQYWIKYGYNFAPNVYEWIYP